MLFDLAISLFSLNSVANSYLNNTKFERMAQKIDNSENFSILFYSKN